MKRIKLITKRDRLKCWRKGHDWKYTSNRLMKVCYRCFVWKWRMNILTRQWHKVTGEQAPRKEGNKMMKLIIKLLKQFNAKLDKKLKEQEKEINELKHKRDELKDHPQRRIK